MISKAYIPIPILSIYKKNESMYYQCRLTFNIYKVFLALKLRFQPPLLNVLMLIQHRLPLRFWIFLMRFIWQLEKLQFQLQFWIFLEILILRFFQQQFQLRLLIFSKLLLLQLFKQRFKLQF